MPTTNTLDFQLSSYDFPLPPEQIAQFPPEKRGNSRLLVLRNGSDGSKPLCEHSNFSELCRFLPKGALLVANNSRVLQARLFGRRATGGKVEFLLLTPLPLLLEAQRTNAGLHEARAVGLLRSNARLRAGETFNFGETLRVRIDALEDFGRCQVTLAWSGDLSAIFESQGHIPLPPYIKREDTALDLSRYQTVYARADKTGSVAAPTAGLHFTDAIRAQLAREGFAWEEVTLYVGYGTFSPVRTSDIRRHQMHSEYIEISPSTAMALSKAKQEGRPIIAVGTTSVRALEGMMAKGRGIIPYQGTTDIFLYPGKSFQLVDGLITNFHLPGSSLIMLVAALTGRERILAVYQEAILHGYRFFSYGDCMLILPRP
ncbi:MAG: tRNA preQ1(34) S-adenosylmethionine ribosyltransferase-isomerase QueA [Desulfovibrio sp.]|nr:tRNA preQ1(34) S-adenosylmethionine ribosyltransferase-isomerase QueA [Desulfovibrio sp.]